jgi:hypothetical protein
MFDQDDESKIDPYGSWLSSLFRIVDARVNPKRINLRTVQPTIDMGQNGFATAHNPALSWRCRPQYTPEQNAGISRPVTQYIRDTYGDGFSHIVPQNHTCRIRNLLAGITLPLAIPTDVINGTQFSVTAYLLIGGADYKIDNQDCTISLINTDYNLLRRTYNVTLCRDLLILPGEELFLSWNMRDYNLDLVPIQSVMFEDQTRFFWSAVGIDVPVGFEPAAFNH